MSSRDRGPEFTVSQEDRIRQMIAESREPVIDASRVADPFRDKRLIRPKIVKPTVLDVPLLDAVARGITPATAPSEFPDGISYFNLSAVAQSDGWPVRGTATGWVINYVMARGASSRIWQEYHPTVWNDNTGHIWARSRNSDDTAWADWGVIIPIRYGSGTGTQHDITTASTWETAFTLTITDLPDFDDCAFDGELESTAVCYATDATNAADCFMRLRVSNDGGTAWNNGRAARTEFAAGEHGDLSAKHNYVNPQPTADIVIEIQVQSTQDTSAFDEFEIQSTWHARA